MYRRTCCRKGISLLFFLLATSVLFSAAFAHAEHSPAHLLMLRLRWWSLRVAAARFAQPGTEGARLTLPSNGSDSPFGDDARVEPAGSLGSPLKLPIFETIDRLAAVERTLRIEAISPPGMQFGGEPYERKAFDFQRMCLNPCPLGGWGTCMVEAPLPQQECEAIANRSLVSSAARRAPMVSDLLKLLGSRTTKLPTDIDRGLRLSANLFRGGGTLGVEARW